MTAQNNRAEVSDEMLEVVARAHDREDAAQKGEPSPWEVFADELDPEWIDERKTAMRCAFDAVSDFAQSARPAAPEGEWVVKPLAWSTSWSAVKAETPIGHYFVEARRDGGFDCRLENMWNVWASSSEQAKAAAQADYDQRIRSALSAAPKPEPASAVQVTDILRTLAENYQKAADSSTGSDRVAFHERSNGVWAAFNHVEAALSQSQPAPHDLYKTGDPDAPDAIKDRNGEVVLDLCRRCGKGEIEISGPCEPAPQPDAKASGVDAARVSDEACDEQLSARPTPPTEAGAEGPEVVAWLCRDLILGSVSIIDDAEHAAARKRQADAWAVEPLIRLSDHNTIVERLSRELVGLRDETLFMRNRAIENRKRAEQAEAALTAERERSARLREALEHTRKVLGETLDKDFAGWSSSAFGSIRSKLWPLYNDYLPDALRELKGGE